jgi:hypothetical protein
MMPSKTEDVGVKFRFRSPLHDVIEQQKGQKFLEMKQMLAEAVAMDPSVAYVPDVLVAFRDAINGIGVPARWQRSESDVEALVRKQQAQQAAGQLLERMKTGSEAAANLAAAGKDNAAAQAVPA